MITQFTSLHDVATTTGTHDSNKTGIYYVHYARFLLVSTYYHARAHVTVCRKATLDSWHLVIRKGCKP